jgi:hypothetical protein
MKLRQRAGLPKEPTGIADLKQQAKPVAFCLDRDVRRVYA